MNEYNGHPFLIVDAGPVATREEVSATFAEFMAWARAEAARITARRRSNGKPLRRLVHQPPLLGAGGVEVAGRSM